MQIVNIYDAKTQLSKLISKVQKGDEVVIGKAGKPVAKLVVFEHDKKSRVFGMLKGKIRIAPDFDAEDTTIQKLFADTV